MECLGRPRVGRMTAVVTRRLDGWSPLRASGGTEIGLQACLANFLFLKELHQLAAFLSVGHGGGDSSH